ncbi:MAG: histidine triad nucleotide-binding protein [Chitinispirillales bacterium]|jgi:histidine triad (HIT) family protein|nr:histidine triad nucleotide-binding protein [Chitinispirillales bacterium]
MSNCIFCKIATGEIPAEKIYESDGAFVIRDINPQAPVHFLAIPTRHYPAVHDIPQSEMASVMGALMDAVREAAKAAGLDANGYRLIVNSGDIAGQTVPHLHIHILGGRDLAWPPG